VRVGLSSALVPIVVFFVVSLVLLMVGGFDPGNTFGVSDEFLGGVLVVVGGLLSGVIVGLFAGMRSWRLAVPAIAGGAVGLAVFLAFVTFGVGGESADIAGVSLWGIWVGQAIGIFLATWLTGFGLVGGALAAAVVGVLLGFGLAAIPESSPELYLVLAEYTVDVSTDECSGTGEMSGVVEGSVLFAFDSSGAEVGSVVLPAGIEVVEGEDPGFLVFPSEEGMGCMFDLGDPFGLEIGEYSQLDFLHESDPDVGQGGTTEGHRLFITFG